MKHVLNFINGELCPAASGQSLENHRPSTGEVYGTLPDSGPEDVERAVQAAKRAFSTWSRTAVEDRVAVLRNWARLIGENEEKLARAESEDNGKPLSLARKLDIPRARRNLEFFADAITQFHGDSFQSRETVFNYTVYAPLGVVACISPWNLPLYLLTWKIAPALAAGCTVVAKPSEVTPMTAHILCELAREAGLPAGVFNVLHGTGTKVGAALCSHPEVRAVSFTGSTETGRAINLAAAKSFKKVSLEMGGKNANIVFADAEFDKALETTVRSTFLNQGQICLCGSRIFVEKPIYEKFKNALVEKARALRVGDPFDEKTDQGALVSKVHRDKVLSYIELAEKEGGRILCGGEALSLAGPLAGGYFVAPTLIENLGPDCRVNQEEIFGPVATLTPFESEQEVIAMANSTRYGLSASVWTNNIHRGYQVAQQLESGIVWVNTWMFRDLRTPFGGVKESGLGREGGIEALKFFSEVKNISLEFLSSDQKGVLR